MVKFTIVNVQFFLSFFLFRVCILLVEKRLVEEVRKNDILIIVGETGSGKTTRMFFLCMYTFSN